jgi:hypothetical protein
LHIGKECENANITADGNEKNQCGNPVVIAINWTIIGTGNMGIVLASGCVKLYSLIHHSIADVCMELVLRLTLGMR